ncbi:hypothetical protein LZG04_39965 [Saccharothrix sp. S26]|uniref:hypothetical protein n=1 Tax=Saccharothrix sp. S26 TaxID=2907215 RepID=UPI001F345308|nr:hypothetical protein [Saccharothrix sp. S26]MCE7000953.1 hypothetical protein [Saccharothrix sp. S26]
MARSTAVEVPGSFGAVFAACLARDLPDPDCGARAVTRPGTPSVPRECSVRTAVRTAMCGLVERLLTGDRLRRNGSGVTHTSTGRAPRQEHL